MRWFELALATIFGALFTAFHFLPGSWCDPTPVRPIAGIFVLVVTMFYLYLVDDERRPVVGAWHRIGVGAVAGVLPRINLGWFGRAVCLAGVCWLRC